MICRSRACSAHRHHRQPGSGRCGRCPSRDARMPRGGELARIRTGALGYLHDRQRVAGSAELFADAGLPARQRERADRGREHDVQGGEYGLQTPWADRGVGINVGAEIGRNRINTTWEFQTGDLSGSRGDRRSRTTVRSTFASCSPKSRCRSSATPSSRSSRSPAATVTPITRSTAATASPRIRTRSRPSSRRSATSASAPATTAPSAPRTSSNCSAPQNVASTARTDPCAGLTAGNPLVATCASIFNLTTAQVLAIEKNPANQYNGQFGGNPNLKPEISDTYTAGVVWQPSFVPGLEPHGRLLQHQGEEPHRRASVQRRSGKLRQSRPTRRSATWSIATLAVRCSTHPAVSSRCRPKMSAGSRPRLFDFNASYNHKFAGWVRSTQASLVRGLST